MQTAGIPCHAGKLNDSIDSLYLLVTRSDVRVSGYSIESAFFFAIQKFPRPHISVFNSNLPVHKYPDSLSVRDRQLVCKAIFG